MKRHRKKQRLKPRQRYLVKSQMHLRKLWKKHKNGQKNTKQQTTSQTVLFQNNTIMLISMATISWVQSEIKDHVVHATQFLSLRLLNLDLKWNMDEKFHSFLHSTSCNATTWTRDVMEDGPSSMDILPRMDSWHLNSVLHIKQRQKGRLVVNTKIASQFQESTKVTLLVEHMVNQVRRKWWKKF